MESQVRRYIDSGRHTVPGWFERVDALLFAAIDESQRRAHLTGDLMEIGTYMGRCAVLLGYFQRPGERLVVCDLFDSGADSNISEENTAEQARSYGDLTRQAFERHFRRFHSRLPDEIIAKPSVALRERADELGKRFRIIHIDGSHEYAAVRSDIRLSRDLLADGGMVIFDDVNARHTPGVAAAVWSAVVNEGLIPQIVTSKLYASWTAVPPLDLSVLSNGWTVQSHIVADRPVLHPQEIGTAQQQLRKWIPPPLVPAAKSLLQQLRGIRSRVRPPS